MRKIGNMKATFCLAAVALTGSLAIAFAADKKQPAGSDACTKAYDKAVLACENAKANCRSRGSDESRCENIYNKCVNDAKKAQADCQGGKPSGTPSKNYPKGPSPD